MDLLTAGTVMIRMFGVTFLSIKVNMFSKKINLLKSLL